MGRCEVRKRLRPRLRVGTGFTILVLVSVGLVADATFVACACACSTRGLARTFFRDLHTVDVPTTVEEVLVDATTADSFARSCAPMPILNRVLHAIWRRREIRRGCDRSCRNTTAALQIVASRHDGNCFPLRKRAFDV